MHGARGGAPVKHGLYTKKIKAMLKRCSALMAESRALAKRL